MSGMDINYLPIRLALGVIVVVLSIVVGLIYKGIDRKLAARMQSRIGPPLRQPFWDVSKLFQKETITPDDAVDWVFHSMPLVALVASLVLILYLPLGPLSPILKGYGDLILVVYLFAIPGLAMATGGFASGSPVAAIGAQREMVMMISYEFPLAIVVLTLAYLQQKSFMAAGAGTYHVFALETYVTNPVWSLVTTPLGIIGVALLLIALLVVVPSELSKIPFDAPEAETEIAGGILAEYSGRDLALFYLSDAVKTFAMGTLVVALFFPYNLSPTLEKWFTLPSWAVGGVLVCPWIIDALFFLFKVFLVVFFAVTAVRVAFPRLKIDKISYVYLVPATLIALVGALFIYLDVVIGGV